MRAQSLWVALAALGMGVTPVMADNPPANTVAATTGTIPSSQTVSVNVPVLRWSRLHGKVSHVNQAENMLEIVQRDDNHIGIPYIANAVGIYKGDHRYDLKDVKQGDEVTVRNLAGGY